MPPDTVPSSAVNSAADDSKRDLCASAASQRIEREAARGIGNVAKAEAMKRRSDMARKQEELSKQQNWKTTASLSISSTFHSSKRSEPVIQEADAINSPAPDQPGAAEDDHTDIECDAPPGPPLCDKCGEEHATRMCPYFQKGRDNHPDATENYGRGPPAHARAATGDRAVFHNATLVRQPGDGSCLYHGLHHGLLKAGKASADIHCLRRELASFLLAHSEMSHNGNTLRQWVEWETPGLPLEDYVERIAQSGWGGGVELACCALSRGVNVHVYHPLPGDRYERVSCFDVDGASHTVHMLFVGRMHYDSLDLH